jgi:hypothetical protein
MATWRNQTIGALRLAGIQNIADRTPGQLGHVRWSGVLTATR